MKKLFIWVVGVLLLVPTLAMATPDSGYVDVTGGGAVLKLDRTWDSNGLVSIHNLVNDSYTTYENGVAVETTMAGEVIADYHYENGVLHSITNQYGDVTYYTNGKQRYTTGTLPDGTIYTKATYEYDDSGRLTGTTGRTAEGQEIRTTFTYDGAILLSSLTQTKIEVEDQEPQWNQGTITTYESGRAVRKDNLDTGGHSIMHYTGVKLTHIDNYDEGEGLVTTTYMDNHGRPDYTNDMAGNLTMDYVYDGAKLVQTVFYPGGATGEFIYVTVYDEYGNIGNEYWVENPNRVPPDPTDDPSADDEHHDPAIVGTVQEVVGVDGAWYVVVAADQIDMYDGSGFVSAAGETFYVEVDEATAMEMEQNIGAEVLLAGDIAEDVDGHLTITMNVAYGGGIAIGEEAIDNYIVSREGAAWYQNLVATMNDVWAEIEQEYGQHSNWRQGFEFLKAYVLGE